jgi:hypothetical protein
MPHEELIAVSSFYFFSSLCSISTQQTSNEPLLRQQDLKGVQNK